MFDFLAHDNNPAVAADVSALQRVSGATLGDYALFLANKRLFVQQAGQRQSDPKVTPAAVMITDGRFLYSVRCDQELYVRLGDHREKIR